MRVLFVALAVPFPPSSGQHLRNWALLRVLAEEGNEIGLISFAEPHEMGRDLGALRQICQSIDLVPLPSASGSRGRAYLSRLKALPSLLPSGASRFRSALLEASVRERLRRGAYDLVICDNIYMAVNLPHPLTVPVLLNKHDLTYVIVRRYLDHEPNPFKRAYGWVEYWKLQRWERQMCAGSTGVLVCSNHDRELLKPYCPAERISVVPNVIDAESYTPVTEDDGFTLLYMGSMDWIPNQDAVAFFISAIFPELRRQVPAVRFVVAGRKAPAKFLRRFEGIPGVEFTGMVPDMRTEMTKAAVCVVPLRMGSGTRLKILEAAAMGLPVVSTSIGAEGLEFKGGEEIVLADEPQAFTRAVADLLSDTSRRRALGRAARRWVEKRYSLPVLRGAVRSVLVELGPKPSVAACEQESHSCIS